MSVFSFLSYLLSQSSFVNYLGVMGIAKLVKKWIVDGFQPYHFNQIDVELSGSSSVGDGYVGGICFAKVWGERIGKGKEEFNVVIKYGKDSPHLREILPVAEVFKNEILLYRTLVPAYKEMEKANNCSEIDSFIPKCFNAILYDNQEVLLLENLKPLGYELYDRQKPFNVDHLKLTLEKYGKLHALGLAYREKNPEEFHKLKLTLQARVKKSFLIMTDVFDITQKIVYSILETKGEFNLLDSLQKEIPSGFNAKVNEFFQVDEPNSVIIHGDCWNNNFMFKYEEENKSKPKAVKFLDFQVIQASSPVYDLAYHIYVTASETELKEFPTLLRVYHNSFSTCLNQLGFNSDLLFPFSELERQWKKYSLPGLLIGLTGLPFTLVDKEDAVDFSSTDESQFKNMYEQIKKKKFDFLVPRVMSNLRHYYQYKNDKRID